MPSDTYKSQKQHDEELRQKSVRENQWIEWIALALTILCIASVIGLLVFNMGGKS